MQIAIIGYGRMGKAIEKIALNNGHSISVRISDSKWDSKDIEGSDVAIEFTQPDAAVSNIKKCFEANVPVVVGTTGWYESYADLSKHASEHQKGLFTATNFSIGVNIMFYLNRKLAGIMNSFPEYDVHLQETHHIDKKDYPSGTASTLAEDVVNELDRKKNYVGQLDELFQKSSTFDLQIICKREDDVPGFHEVSYESKIDEIKISHNAKSREGFAVGALRAAEWMKGKTGTFGMKDLLKFET